MSLMNFPYVLMSFHHVPQDRAEVDAMLKRGAELTNSRLELHDARGVRAVRSSGTLRGSLDGGR